LQILAARIWQAPQRDWLDGEDSSRFHSSIVMQHSFLSITKSWLQRFGKGKNEK
jgi:hypothetical protein